MMDSLIKEFPATKKQLVFSEVVSIMLNLNHYDYLMDTFNDKMLPIEKVYIDSMKSGLITAIKQDDNLTYAYNEVGRLIYRDIIQGDYDKTAKDWLSSDSEPMYWDDAYTQELYSECVVACLKDWEELNPDIEKTLTILSNFFVRWIHLYFRKLPKGGDTPCWNCIYNSMSRINRVV